MGEKLTIDLDNLSEDERKQLLALIEKANKPKSTVWKPKDNEKYLFFNTVGVIASDRWTNHPLDKDRYAIGNCFNTKEEAEFTVERLKVIAELNRFAEEHNSPKFNKMDFDCCCFSIYYAKTTKDVRIYNYLGTINSGIIFESREIAEAAINAIGKERIKKYYFEIKQEGW